MYLAMAFKRFLKVSDYMSKFCAMKLPVFIMDTRYCSQRNGYPQFEWVVWPSQKRLMTTSKRVQDRSKRKRVHDLEIATEKLKITSKVLFLLELLNQQPEQIIPLRSLEQYRRQINLPKPHKISDFLRKSPKLFELYKDHNGVIWCGMTKEAEDLVEEEMKILDGEHQENVVEYVTRFLMMSIDKRLPLDKIAHFRRDLGLPYDFRINWVHKHPKHFRVVKSEDDVEYLELTSWNPAWAVTELEKKVYGVVTNPSTPGVLSLPFPMKFPSNYKKIFRYGGQIETFRKDLIFLHMLMLRGSRLGLKSLIRELLPSCMSF
ncbi:hypothetical protein Syun_015088 [Stephania yunnanensis]|uniref:PORR domain-containing protein n=1 Tax=Stephania yunnanensis TaxID=152371 RepID=A0AAP0P932_9MAGN